MIIEGGNFGVQLGGSATDVVLLIMNRGGMDHLLHDKFTLGADLAVAQGMGYSASANADVFMRAPMISWSRSKGLFVGLSLEGASLRPDKGEDRKLYGRDIDNIEILTKRTPAPRGARPFITALNHFAPGGGTIVGFVRGVADALDLRAAAHAGLLIAAMHRHIFTKSCHLLGKAVAGFAPQLGHPAQKR